jgi:DNA polymerase III sliding clamp (beta) subunit (PCNA family)
VTTVTFENATIRDVIGKAAKIAPTKGSAFDRAAGILIEVDAEKSEVIVKATNIEVFYMEVVDVVSIEGPSVTWRIPSMLLDGICNKLPITSGATIAFEEMQSSQIRLATGRMRATLRLMDVTYFPKWSAFDPAQLSPVSDFGARLQQVQWAASKTQPPPMSGINLDGHIAGATDQYRIAITPCEIPQFYEPITIPAATFTPMMKTLGEVKIGQEDGQLLVMPDEATQIRAVIYDLKYPNLAGVMNGKRDQTHAVFIKKDYLLDMVEQAMVIGARDRTPIIKIILGQQELAVLMEDQELGLLGNVMEVAGQADHERHYIGFTPDNLTSALRSAPNDDVSIYYTAGMPMKPIRIDGGSGYEVLVMPRNLERSADE